MFSVACMAQSEGKEVDKRKPSTCLESKTLYCAKGPRSESASQRVWLANHKPLSSYQPISLLYSSPVVLQHLKLFNGQFRTVLDVITPTQGSTNTLPTSSTTFGSKTSLLAPNPAFSPLFSHFPALSVSQLPPRFVAAPGHTKTDTHAQNWQVLPRRTILLF